MSEAEGAGGSPTIDDGSVSLEELAHAVAFATGASPDAPPPPAARSVAEPEPDIDDVLAEEDPEFASSMSALKASADFANVEISDPGELAPLDAEPEAEPLPSGRIARLATTLRRWVHRGATFASKWIRWAVTVGSIELAKAVLARAKAAALGLIVLLKRFSGLPLAAKLLVLPFLALLAAAAGISWALWSGWSLSLNESPFLETLASVADAEFEVDPEGAIEEFDSPLRAAEHVVLLEKTVVNLRRVSGETTNPMGLFEFYVEASSREAAIELSDRKSESRDVVQRALETMSWAELEGESGKRRAKRIIRRDLNEMLTKGRVRNVYFKTVILKD